MNDGIRNPAVIAALDAQRQIHEALDANQSFRLEAGAGAGKTYSLVTALRYLIERKGSSLTKLNQKVACITYTEVARNEIAQEIDEHPAVLVSTIHGFSWAFMRPFQKELRTLVSQMTDRNEKIAAVGGVGSQRVEYDVGFFGIDAEKITLSHDDIPELMSKLLYNEKFRSLLAQQFPIIFVDEYQDTHGSFMASISESFLQKEAGALVGLFGDHWQTIYRNEYQFTNYPLVEISKGSNFRSAPAIVNVLNKLRPELTQAVSDDTTIGEARFFHTNAYQGERTAEAHSKADLPPDKAREIRQTLMNRLEASGWEQSKTKVLMLTHNSMAAEQGYPTISEIFSSRTEQFVKKENPAIKFFADIVEPMCSAYSASRYGDMFRIFGHGPAITKHEDKECWRRDMDELLRIRIEGSVGDVIDHLKRSQRPILSDRLLKYEEFLEGLQGAPIPETNSAMHRYSRLRGVLYSEVIDVVKFIDNQTPFATQHSVKGAEFENVLVVLGGGWSHYNWPKLLELLTTKTLNKQNSKGYYRARNLFYVSISRPMKRLAVIATQVMPDDAITTVNHLFGSENVEDLFLAK